MTSKGKERVAVVTSNEIKVTFTRISISQLLTTPKPFNLNIIMDVNWEIK